MPEAQSSTGGDGFWSAWKTGEKHNSKEEVSMGSTKAGVVQQSLVLHAQEDSLGQKQELPLMPLSSSSS